MIGSHVSQLKWYIKKTHHSAWNKIDRNKNDFFMIFFSNPLGVLYPRYFYSSISPFIEPQMIVTWKRSIKIRKKTLDMISDVKASSELTLGFFSPGVEWLSITSKQIWKRGLHDFGGFLRPSLNRNIPTTFNKSRIFCLQTKLMIPLIISYLNFEFLTLFFFFHKRTNEELAKRVTQVKVRNRDEITWQIREAVLIECIGILRTWCSVSLFLSLFALSLSLPRWHFF